MTVKINKGFIFAAGLGLRMRPLTNNTPKPLIRVNGKPLIDYSIELLTELGVNEIAINTHYLSDQVEDYISKKHRDKNIVIFHEDERLETGGGLKNASKFIEEEEGIITINSDMIFSNFESVKSSIEFSMNNKFIGSDIIMMLKQKDKIYGYNGLGDFNLSSDNLVEKQENNILTFCGFQIIKPQIVTSWPKKIFSLSEIFNSCLKDKKISGIILESEVFHVGDTEGLKTAENLL